MAKLKVDPIGQSDLIEHLNNTSDFAFEVQTLNELITRGFDCDYGGTYDDPVTRKPREFDIRLRKRMGKRFLRCAIECKNLRANFPLLISCLPRKRTESFHQIIYSVNPETNAFYTPDPPYSLAQIPTSISLGIDGEFTFYSEGEPVGKSCEQVGRQNHDGEITATDSGIYDKWAQALSSAEDLIDESCCTGQDITNSIAMSLVFAILVVPNERLWMAQFNEKGAILDTPKLVDRCPYFVGREYVHNAVMHQNEFKLSHLEIVTSKGLTDLLDLIVGNESRVSDNYPFEKVAKFLRNQRFD